MNFNAKKAGLLVQIFVRPKDKLKAVMIIEPVRFFFKKK